MRYGVVMKSKKYLLAVCFFVILALSVSSWTFAGTIVTATDPAPSISSTDALALCPTNMRPTGGGYIWPFGLTSAGGNERVTENRPTGAGNGEGWYVAARSPSSVPPVLRPITAYVICTT